MIAGQSIGGMIAQEMAIRHPHRIAGLVLIATVPAFGGRDDSFAIPSLPHGSPRWTRV